MHKSRWNYQTSMRFYAETPAKPCVLMFAHPSQVYCGMNVDGVGPDSPSWHRLNWLVLTEEELEQTYFWQAVVKLVPHSTSFAFCLTLFLLQC